MIQRLGVDIKKAKCLLGTSRPTAVNLAWALDKVVKLINFTITSIFPPTIISIANNCTIDIFKVSEAEDMEKAAMAIHNEDIQLCRRLGQVLRFQNNLNVLAGFNTDLRYVRKFTRPIKVRKLWLLLLKKKQQKCINISYFSSFFVKILIVSVQNHTWCV